MVRDLAGHCTLPANGGNGVAFRFGGDWPGQPLVSPGVGIGVTFNNNFYTANNQTDCDCVAIGPVPASFRSASHYVTGGVVPYYYVAIESSYYTGRPACRAGATSRWTCGGSITDPHFSAWLDYGGDLGTHFHYEFVRTSVDGCQGDSGGPLVGQQSSGSWTVLMGVLSAGYGYYANDAYGNRCYADTAFSRSTLIASRIGVGLVTG